MVCAKGEAMKKSAMFGACIGCGLMGAMAAALFGAGRADSVPRASDYGFLARMDEGTKVGWESARAFPIVAEAAPSGGFVVVITPLGTGMVVSQDGTATPIVFKVPADGGTAAAVPNLRRTEMKDPVVVKQGG
jgi:hypothetical protein